MVVLTCRRELPDNRARPMLETSIVGSLPKPSWLAEPNMLRAPWRLSGDELRDAQDDAVRLADSSSINSESFYRRIQALGARHAKAQD